MILTPTDLTFALKDLAGRQPTYRLNRRYLDGDHRLAFASDAFRSAFGTLFRTFAYNRCPTVVDAVADRLQIVGWESDGDGGETIEKAAEEIWQRNRMPRRQGEVHKESLSAGDSYVIVWPDEEGLARIHPNAGHLIVTQPEEEAADRLAYAAKCWQVQRGEYAGYWRVTVYEPDLISRFITKSKRTEMPTSGHLTEFDRDGEAETDNPYGQVPVFHFANNAAMGQPGRSELADVIPLQDGLNKSLMDMLVTGEFLGFPQRWAVGIEPEIGEDGKPVNPFDVGRDRMFMAASELAKFGSFDAADITQFVTAQDAWDAKVARVSSTPLHWIIPTGTPPSGDSLKEAAAPFFAKVEDRHTAFGDVWGDATAFALRVEGAAEDVANRIRPIWKPAASQSKNEALDQALKKQALGVPPEQIWAELEYTPDEIAEFTKAREAAAKKAAEQFAKSFDRGEGLDDDEEAA